MRPAFEGMTAEELDTKCRQILLDCETAGRPKTIQRLAWDLGISRETFNLYTSDNREKDEGSEYERFEAHSDVLKKARQEIELSAAEEAIGKSKAGQMFHLKAMFGWQDRNQQEVVVSGPIDLRVSLVSPDGKHKVGGGSSGGIKAKAKQKPPKKSRG